LRPVAEALPFFLKHFRLQVGFSGFGAHATGWRIANQTPLPVVCFTREDAIPSDLVRELRDRQIAWMSDVEIGGKPAVRACITSFKTTEQDIAWVVDQLNTIVSNMPRRKTI